MEMELRKEIESLISELLPAHGCVIIPGLGGFITHYKPAYVQSANGKILPPAAETGFNPALRTNDGLLAQALAQKTGIPYNVALEKLQSFSWECLAALNAGKEIHLKNIGTLKYDEYKNFRFESDKHTNLLDDAFGLAPVSAIPLKHPAKPFHRQDRKPERSSRIKTKHALEALRWTVMLLPIILLALYSVYQTGVLEGWVSYSSFSGIPIPDNKSTTLPSADEKLRESYFAGIQWPAPLPVENETPTADTTLSVIVFKTDIPKPQASNNKPDVQNTTNLQEINSNPIDTKPLSTIKDSNPTLNNNIKGKYHLIIGCFKEKTNANRLIADLKLQGITAFEAGTTPAGLTRVSLGGFDTRSEAEQAVKELNKINSSDIWIGKL